jgi:putative two-component system response regulator
MPDTVLIVDDEPTNLLVLTQLLRPDYRVRAVTSGEAALRAATQSPLPDLILLDVMMPRMDGFEVLARLRAAPATRHLPVVLVTALADPESEERGLGLGAADYVTKPIRPAVVLARVRTQLDAKRARDLLRGQNEALEAEVARRMRENDLTQQVTIRALAHLAEMRDTDTGMHIHRTQSFVRILASELAAHPRFEPGLDAAALDQLVRSAPLHDIGKVGIPDRILLKPGPLTSAEWALMKRHTVLGADAIGRAQADVHEPLPFLDVAKKIARWHHEKWDGSGYPDGLAGDAIPVAARLMALADVFDALISRRVYKEAMTLEEARDVIVEGRRVQFDPDVVGAFAARFHDFTAVAERVAAPA